MDGQCHIHGTGRFGINTSGEKSSTSETLMALRGCRSAAAPPRTLQPLEERFLMPPPKSQLDAKVLRCVG